MSFLFSGMRRDQPRMLVMHPINGQQRLCQLDSIREAFFAEGARRSTCCHIYQLLYLFEVKITICG